ncbi:zinc ribbon domain-containing protein [Ktedonospora formicarum]|uniref:DZANK-type domain-containing protein n=1 Tax=Ktedonospora formicarum TaxID=2778364 RepID=A0A8J3I098_9CHLR|nr:zinc ribbon domain-containing protein [Ktedonospora formicarum]GHO42519.1 hypothetical protein KSX_06820 [Ktedonospora formicarum]
MDNRFYPLPNLDLERMARDIEDYFVRQGYQVQHFGMQDQVAVQMRKGGELEALVGLQAALTVTLQKVQGGVAANIGQQQWIDKAAVGAIGVFFLWPLMVTAGAGLIRQAGLETQIFNAVDIAVQRQGGRPYSPPHYSTRPYGQSRPSRQAVPMQCPHCQAQNDEGDAYCSYCGKSLRPEPKKVSHCQQCGATLKPDAAFCAKCGQAVSREEAAK